MDDLVARSGSEPDDSAMKPAPEIDESRASFVNFTNQTMNIDVTRDDQDRSTRRIRKVDV